jgi:hypothetical protein
MQASPVRFRRVLWSVALALPIIAGLVAPRGTAGAQIFSEYSEAPYAELVGLQEAIQRKYDNIATAFLIIHADIARFDTEANAAAGFETLNAFYLEAFATAASPLAFEPVDAPSLGADTRAYHATIEEFGSRHEAAFAQVLHGVYVYGIMVLNANNDTIAVAVDQAAVDMLEGMIATPAGVGTPMAAGEFAGTGGTWDKFPKVGDEVPERYGILNASDTLWFASDASFATPVTRNSPYGNTDDLVAIVERSYRTVDPDTGEPVAGGQSAYIQIAEVADPATVASAFAAAGPVFTGEFEDDGTTLEPAEADVSADDVAAWTGQIEDSGQHVQVALVLVRSGPYVVLVIAFSPEAVPLAFASDLAQATVDAETESGPGELTLVDGYVGGIWDKLPATGDAVLDGLVVYEEEQIHP